MLTRLEISGFKSFTDFEVDFAPLTVIAGANASGKSNLIEALRLVQGLAMRGSFGMNLSGRGNINDIFTKFDAETNADIISVAVEIKLPWNYLNISPDFLLDYNRFRYEVEISHHTHDEEGAWFEITKERLRPITKEKMSAYIDHGFDEKSTTGPLYHFGAVRGNLTSTSLSEASFSSDPHVYACQRALKSIILTDLISPTNFSDHNQLNHTSRTNDPEGILASLTRFKKSSSDHLHYLSQRLRRIVSDLVSVDVYNDEFNRSTVTATDTGGRRFLANDLSEGTLRVIALASYLLKRKLDQVLLIEEPENGIDPRVISEMVALLNDLSVSHNEEKGEQWQVICTTHSPILLKEILNLKNQGKVAVLLASKVGYLKSIEEKRFKLKVTRMNAIIRKENINENSTPLELYTLREAMEYLSISTEEKTTEDA